MRQRRHLHRQIILYVVGVFVLSFGVSLSIQAGLGVSPVSSLAYGMSLTIGLTIGITTLLANLLFIAMQIVLSRRIEWNNFALQLIISFLFGFFMDVTFFLVQFFPTPETMLARCIYLVISFFVIAIGLMVYFAAKLPLMPYDALTYVVSEKFQWKLSKAKIISDFINVSVAGGMCIIFIHTLGSIGIGTILAAYFVGKILGWLIPRYQKTLDDWLLKREKNVSESA